MKNKIIKSGTLNQRKEKMKSVSSGRTRRRHQKHKTMGHSWGDGQSRGVLIKTERKILCHKDIAENHVKILAQ